MTKRTTAIIGGGFTGLVAALRLAQQGVQVTVIEAASELGGLAASFEMGGEPLEKAYHHLFRTDHEILALIHELDLGERLEWRESSLAIFRGGRLWPFMSPKDLLCFGACSITGRVRLGIVAMVLKYRKDWQSLTRIPALQWMRRYCGVSATSAVWEPLLRGKFSFHADEVSMSWLWARLHVRGNSRETGGGGEKLGYIRGGFVRIVAALESRLLEHGVRIERNTRIERLEPADGRISLVRNGMSETFDAALFTGSNGALLRTLPNSGSLEAYRRSLKEIHYLGAVCMIFETDQKLGDFYWVNVNEPDWPFLVMIRHTRLIPAERYGGREIYYLAAYVPHDDPRFTMADSELTALWFAALRRMFPEFDASRTSAWHCFRFRDAQHVVDCSYEEKIIPHEGPFDGMYLANFAQIFPHDRGTNYAVREGEKVARLIQAMMDKSR